MKKKLTNFLDERRRSCIVTRVLQAVGEGKSTLEISGSQTIYLSEILKRRLAVCHELVGLRDGVSKAGYLVGVNEKGPWLDGSVTAIGECQLFPSA